MNYFDVQCFTVLRTALLQTTLILPSVTAPQWSVNLDSIPTLMSMKVCCYVLDENGIRTKSLFPFF